MNQKRTTPDQHMDHLYPLIPIEQYVFTKTFGLYILSYCLHLCFLRFPCTLLTCPKLIYSTRQTGASVGLRRTWSNHHRQFSLIFSSIEATPIVVRISTFLTLSLLILPHIQRSMRISATLILWAWYLFIAQHSVPYKKASRTAVLYPGLWQALNRALAEFI